MRHILAETIFWTHLAVVLFWWGLFFVPTSAWPDKISFHFLRSSHSHPLGSYSSYDSIFFLSLD